VSREPLGVFCLWVEGNLHPFRVRYGFTCRRLKHMLFYCFRVKVSILLAVFRYFWLIFCGKRRLAGYARASEGHLALPASRFSRFWGFRGGAKPCPQTAGASPFWQGNVTPCGSFGWNVAICRGCPCAPIMAAGGGAARQAVFTVNYKSLSASRVARGVLARLRFFVSQAAVRRRQTSIAGLTHTILLCAVAPFTILFFIFWFFNYFSKIFPFFRVNGIKLS
jgi:hypothetical protein